MKMTPDLIKTFNKSYPDERIKCILYFYQDTDRNPPQPSDFPNRISYRKAMNYYQQGYTDALIKTIVPKLEKIGVKILSQGSLLPYVFISGTREQISDVFQIPEVRFIGQYIDMYIS